MAGRAVVRSAPAPTADEVTEARVLGHAPLLAHLAAKLEEGSPPQSIVFAGPQGVGKRTCAIWYARLLLCTDRRSPDAPCDDCAGCRKVLGGTHPDVYEVRRREERTQIVAEQIDHVIRAAAFPPLEAEHRLFLFSEAHLLNETCMNMLLKTLEEPRPEQTFILIAPTTRALLPTVLSRSQVHRFGPVAQDVMADWLSARCSDAARAALAASLSEGRPGFALKLLRDEALWQLRSRILDAAESLARADAGTALTVGEQLGGLIDGDKRQALDHILSFLGAWVRDVCWISHGLDDARLINLDRADALRRCASRYAPERARSAMAAIDEARGHVQRNVNTTLLLGRLSLHLRP